MPTSFPTMDYDTVIHEAYAIISDRSAQGRNGAVGFYEGFPHGHTDISFELWRRVARILGAEKAGKMETARKDAVDLLNYAAFYVMVLDRDIPNPEVRHDTNYPPYFTDAISVATGPTSVGCDGAD